MRYGTCERLLHDGVENDPMYVEGRVRFPGREDRETGKFTVSGRVRDAFFSPIFCVSIQNFKIRKSTFLVKTKFWNSKNKNVNHS
jgi:hypothetical protein